MKRRWKSTAQICDLESQHSGFPIRLLSVTETRLPPRDGCGGDFHDTSHALRLGTKP